MIRHKTFQTTHLMNVLGSQGMKRLGELRAEAQYFASNLPADSVISIAETRDMYASTVTVWYWGR